MYEKEILDELRVLNRRMARLEELFLDSKQYAGLNFQDCLERIAFNTDHLRN